MFELYEFINSKIIFLEALCLLIGVYCYRKQMKGSVLIVLVYVTITLLIELVALLFTFNNQWLYNLLGIFELGIIFSLFFFYAEKAFLKHLIIILALINLGILLYEMVVIKGTALKYLAYTWGFTSICIAIISIVYIITLVQTEKVIVLTKQLLFWVATGLMLYHLCNLPVTVLTHLLDQFQSGKNIIILQPISSIMMYLSFIIGFIWSQKNFNT